MNEEIKVILIDDERMWLRTIASTLNDFGYTVAGTAERFGDAVDMLSTNHYDIALVDINLDGKNKGIELGKMLSNIYNKPFIFITGSTSGHTLSEAISAGPSAYLTKPVHPASLVATLHSAINNFNNRITPAANMPVANNDTFFFVKQGNKYRKIDWQHVVYLRSDKNYTIIYNDIDKAEYYIRSTLSKTLSLIVPAQLKNSFVQVNRAEAIQVRYIQEIADEEIRTAHGTFTITETYGVLLRKAIRIIM